MKPGSVPSYLFFSRHGLYYFRCRIPLKIPRKYDISQAEIHRSLQTSNRKEALRKASRLWVEEIDPGGKDAYVIPAALPPDEMTSAVFTRFPRGREKPFAYRCLRSSS
jgi:hypothetical protein